MSVTEKLGGIPALTAVLVILTGVLGSAFGISFLKLLKVKSPKAVGLAMGTAAHGLGTAKVSEKGAEYGAYGGLAMALCGLFTAILTPILIPLFI